MLRVRFVRVRADKVQRLRWWMGELERRRDEVLKTFANETVQHEVAWLLETADGPVLVYAVEAEDMDRAERVVAESPFPIDRQHRAVMAEIEEGRLEPEVVLDVRA